MLLAHKPHTVGDRRRYIVDYSQWLDTGVTAASATASTASTTASVDTVSNDTTTVTFFINGGILNEIFTVAVQMTDSLGEVKNDSIEYFVQAP